MFLVTFLPREGMYTTIVCLGTQSTVLIGLLREYGPYTLHFLNALPERAYLEIEGVFPLMDFRQ